MVPFGFTNARLDDNDLTDRDAYKRYVHNADDRTFDVVDACVDGLDKLPNKLSMATSFVQQIEAALHDVHSTVRTLKDKAKEKHH